MVKHDHVPWRMPVSLRAYPTQGLAKRTQLMAMGSRGVDLAKQALSSVHGKVSAAMQPIVILAFPDSQVF